MGCDVHIFIEFNKTTSPNEWKCVSSFYVLRLRNVISAMSGLLGIAKQPLLPRGFPVNVSEEITEKFNQDTDYYHTPTWMYLDEYLGSLKRNDIEILNINNDFRLIAAIMSGIEKEFGQRTTRLVCYFDN